MPAAAMLTATIAAGESLSTAVDLTTGTPVAVYIPPTWASAIMTFQVGDGTFFGDLFDKMADEVSINVEPGTVVQLDQANNKGVLFIKFRSGSRSLPVNQSVQQDLKVFLETPIQVNPSQ